MPIPLQPSVVYGPVHSRRLGTSLGINPLPAGLKVCNFNCVYCQYGSTHGGWETVSRAARWPAARDLLREIENALQRLSSAPDHLTIAGNGEPTAHPQFSELVDGLVTLRDRYVPAAKTAILSNASFLHIPSVWSAIQKLDLKILKIDCGDERLFLRYNRPTVSIDFENLLRMLNGLEGVTIQAMFTGGRNGNDDAPAVDSWIRRIEDLSPSMVQIYSLDRDCEDPGLQTVSRDRLEAIRLRLAESSVPSQVY